MHLLDYDLSVAEYVTWGVLTSLDSLKSSRVACLPIAYVDQYNDVSGSIVNVGSSMYRGKGCFSKHITTHTLDLSNMILYISG